MELTDSKGLFGENQRVFYDEEPNSPNSVRAKDNLQKHYENLLHRGHMKVSMGFGFCAFFVIATIVAPMLFLAMFCALLAIVSMVVVAISGLRDIREVEVRVNYVEAPVPPEVAEAGRILATALVNGHCKDDKGGD